MTAQDTHHIDFNAQQQHDCIVNTYTLYTNIMVSGDKFYQPQTYMLYLWWSDPAMPQPQHSKLSPFHWPSTTAS